MKMEIEVRLVQYYGWDFLRAAYIQHFNNWQLLTSKKLWSVTGRERTKTASVAQIELLTATGSI